MTAVCSENKTKINILVYGIGDRLGGIETFLYNMVVNFDPDKYHFDFLIFDDIIPCFYEELVALGCGFIRITGRKRNYIKNRSQLKTILKTNKYALIHCNLNSLSYIDPILLGVKYGVGVIAHSHNAEMSGSNIISKILNDINRCRMPYKKIMCVAVSDYAGKWMFKEKHNVYIVHNSIDINTFQFDEEKRERIRSEFSLCGNNIILHVGRFSRQKNHKKIIEIFCEYKKKHDDAKLLLVGDGELKSKMLKLAEKNGLKEAIIFSGKRMDTDAFYSAADKFLFPSLYEGFPISLIEAEASGLYCVVSDVITKEAMLNPLCKSVSLNAGSEEWVSALEGTFFDRKKAAKILRKNGLEMENEVKKLSQIYEKTLVR